MEEKNLKCLRCGCEMRFVSRELIRLAPQNFLDTLAEEKLEADIYVCPQCRKMEFFASESLVPQPIDGSVQTVTCAGCGKAFEYGRTSCPHCGRQYISCPNCGAMHDVYVSFCPNCRHERKKKKSPEAEPWEL